MKLLMVTGLKVEIEDKPILRGVTLTVEEGEVVVIMGPNGSGKTTLANTLAGYPRCRIKQGEVRFMGQDLSQMSPDERARVGFFLAFQYPVEVPGVNVFKFLHLAYNQVYGKVSFAEFRRILRRAETKLGIKKNWAERNLNEGFSGGEKKQFEILSLVVLKPKLVVLDETDSGLDIDSLKTVTKGINRVRKENPKMGVLLITHYQRVLDYIKPNKVLIMVDGKVVENGGRELVNKLEIEGYQNWVKRGV